MATAEKTYKASVSIRERNWNALADVKNKSKIINQALDLYFDYEISKQDFEEKFYGKWLDEALVEVDTGKTTPMLLKNGKIDFDAFDKRLGL